MFKTFPFDVCACKIAGRRNDEFSKRIQIDKNRILEDVVNSNFVLNSDKSKSFVKTEYILARIPASRIDTDFAKDKLFMLDEKLLKELYLCNFDALNLYAFAKSKYKNHICDFTPIFEQRSSFTVVRNEIDERVVDLNKLVFRYYFSQDLNLLIYIVCSRSCNFFPSRDFTVKLNIIQYANNLDFKEESRFSSEDEVRYFFKFKDLLTYHNVRSMIPRDFKELAEFATAVYVKTEFTMHQKKNFCKKVCEYKGGSKF